MSTLAQDNFLLDNWKYLLAALVMHAAIGVMLTVSIDLTKRTVAPATLAIQGVIIDNTQKRLQREREKAEAERRAREETERQRELEEQAEAKRQETERVEKERQEQLVVDQKRKAEQQRLATATKLREAERKKAADKQKAERETRERAARESELKRQLADEAERMAAVAGGAQAEYFAQIQAKIERNWSRPASARPGISCELTVSQAPGGIVLSVKIGTCNGDSAVRESIETAVNKSSPLPMPSDSRMFQRSLTLRFKPDG